MTPAEPIREPVVILGASHGGLAVATELRNAGYAGELLMIGRELGLPYHRPQLSKECLGGDTPEPKPIRPAEFYAERRISLLGGRTVTRLDRANRRLQCADGTSVGYGTLIIATGAEANRLAPELDAKGRAHILRDRAGWLHFVPKFRSASSLAVIGGGLIGLEVAAAARARGCAVTVVEAGERLLMRSLYPEVADRVLRRHVENGLDIRLGAEVVEIDDDALALSSGERIRAGLVLAAIGSRPCTDLAETAGLTCRDGIEVDPHGQTGDPAIFALGDCARWSDGAVSCRHESIAATAMQAKAVAAFLTGAPAVPSDPLRLWSTQGALRLQMTGPVVAQADTRIRETEAGGCLLEASLDGKAIAVQALDAPRPFNASIANLGKPIHVANA